MAHKTAFSSKPLIKYIKLPMVYWHAHNVSQEAACSVHEHVYIQYTQQYTKTTQCTLVFKRKYEQSKKQTLLANRETHFNVFLNSP